MNSRKMWLTLVAMLVVAGLGVYYYWLKPAGYSGEGVYAPAPSGTAEEQDVAVLEQELQGIATEGLDAELTDIDKELLR